MGDIRTTMFQPVNLDGFNLSAYAKAWQNILIEVGLLDKGSTGDDVLIVRQPTQEDAVSAYTVVTTIEWSANNPDFTDWSRTVDLKTLKQQVNQLVKDQIVPQFFPELIGKKMAFNVWLKRWDSAAFCIGIS